MKAILVGAGRGSRLMPATEDLPKCLVDDLGGRRLLDWILDAMAFAGVRDVVFVGGYRIEEVRSRYPALRYYENRHWESTEILTSLMCASAELDGDFVFSYTDLLYSGELVKRVLEGEGDITVAVDHDWRRRYAGRADHPESGAENVELDGNLVLQIGKHVSGPRAEAEFLGLARFSTAAGERLRRRYAQQLEIPSEPFRNVGSLAKAYVTDMMQELIEGGAEVRSVPVGGAWFELDREQDMNEARAFLQRSRCDGEEGLEG